jgi:hypothetical protein
MPSRIRLGAAEWKKKKEKKKKRAIIFYKCIHKLRIEEGLLSSLRNDDFTRREAKYKVTADSAHNVEEEERGVVEW